MQHADPRQIEEITVREIAVEANVDPRSVRKALSGRRVRGVAGERIQRAIARRNLTRPPPNT